jgi:hypothetical protein
MIYATGIFCTANERGRAQIKRQDLCKMWRQSVTAVFPRDLHTIGGHRPPLQPGRSLYMFELKPFWKMAKVFTPCRTPHQAFTNKQERYMNMSVLVRNRFMPPPLKK